MTREEAIEILKEYRTIVMNCLEAETPAFDMAIEALSADAILTKIQIDDIDKAKASSQLLDDLAVDMVNAMGKRIVEVVRCKDCRWWQDNNNGYPHANCHWCETETPDEDDFCSLGERREP